MLAQAESIGKALLPAIGAQIAPSTIRLASRTPRSDTASFSSYDARETDFMWKNRVMAVALLVLCQTALADIEEEVRCREVGFAKALAAKDIEAFKSHIDADARFFGNAIRRKPDGIAHAWRNYFKEDGPSIVWRPQYTEVLDSGTLAMTRGPYRYRDTNDDGSLYESWGHFNSVWRLNDDGVWRVVFDAGDPSAGEPSDEERALIEGDDGCEE